MENVERVVIENVGVEGNKGCDCEVEKKSKEIKSKEYGSKEQWRTQGRTRIRDPFLGSELWRKSTRLFVN